MFIGACVEINVGENVFVCGSAFVLKTSSNLLCGWSHTIIEDSDWAACLAD